MSDAKSPSDLSIDEILTTIRRIISEDEEVSAAAEGSVAAAAVAAISTAATTSAAAEGGPAVGAPSGSAAAAGDPVGALDDVLELTEAINEDGTTRHLAPIGGSVRRVAARPVAAPAQLARDLPVGAGARTLEDLVGDVLRPLLQAWLDQNLPPVVERLVQAEIVRVAREAGSA